MDDTISRQAAIKAICEDGTWLESQGCTEITMAERKQRDADILCELPSVQPKITSEQVNEFCEERGWVAITKDEYHWLKSLHNDCRWNGGGNY